MTGNLNFLGQNVLDNVSVIELQQAVNSPVIVIRRTEDLEINVTGYPTREDAILSIKGTIQERSNWYVESIYVSGESVPFKIETIVTIGDVRA